MPVVYDDDAPPPPPTAALTLEPLPPPPPPPPPITVIWINLQFFGFYQFCQTPDPLVLNTCTFVSIFGMLNTSIIVKNF